MHNLTTIHTCDDINHDHLSQILWGTIHEGTSLKSLRLLKLLDLSFLVLTFPYLSNLSEPFFGHLHTD